MADYQTADTGKRAIVTDPNCFYRGRTVEIVRKYWVGANNCMCAVVRLADHQALSFHVRADRLQVCA